MHLGEHVPCEREQVGQGFSPVETEFRFEGVADTENLGLGQAIEQVPGDGDGIAASAVPLFDVVPGHTGVPEEMAYTAPC